MALINPMDPFGISFETLIQAGNERRKKALGQQSREAMSSMLPMTQQVMTAQQPGEAQASATLPLTQSVMNQQPNTQPGMGPIMQPRIAQAQQAAAAGGAPAQQSPGGGQTLRQSVALTTAQRGGGGAPAAGGSPEGVGWDEYLKGVRDKRGELDKQLEDAYRPPDYSTLQAQAMQRGQDATKSNMASILAGLGPSGAQAFTKGMAARAADLAGNMKVSGGEITGEGEVMLDPGFQAQRKIELLAKRIDALDKLEQSALSSQEKAQLARQAQADRMEMRRLVAAVAMSKQEGGGDKTRSVEGTSMDPATRGMPVFLTNGGLVVQTPQGMQPYNKFPVGPKMTELSGSERGEFASAWQSRDVVEKAGQFMDNWSKDKGKYTTNPVTGALEAISPAWSATLNLTRDKEFKSNRSMLLNAITEFRVGRTGVTLTPTEYADSEKYLPAPTDTPAELGRKARDFVEWQQGVLERKTAMLGPRRALLPPELGGSSLPGARGATVEQRGMGYVR